MPLTPGTRLGPYEVTIQIGAGGMGEVYEAIDTRLKRRVAIKVLPESVAADKDRLARFQREAEVLASLNHPHIAAIFGLEDADGGKALVMELVEGEDLAQRLRLGAIPVDDAVAIAKQIAEALEEAHERGIIHRDLKPANIKVTPDGKVKVLDFGLAKALENQGPESAASSPQVSHSPTMSRHATEAGLILGTAAYMSPEQARGRKVDKRADIWAFGVVLYEMLSGTRLFSGETVSDTLAAVLTRDPDWNSLPKGTPAVVFGLLQRCLRRDVRDRLRDIGEARVALTEPTSGATRLGAVPDVLPTARAPRNQTLLIVVAALSFVASMVAMGLWSRPRPTGAVPTHVDLAFPKEMESLSNLTSGFAISPDGRTVVMVGVTLGSRRLFVRHLSDDKAFEITDPTGVNGVVFSPDSQSLLYQSTRGVLMTLSLADQQRKVVAKDSDLLGSMAWGNPGIVFFRQNDMWLAPSDGGPERLLVKLDPGRQERLLSSPSFLPDGRILFSSLTSEAGGRRIEALSLDGKIRTVVLENANTPVYSPTGYLIFGRDGALMATAFDPVSLKIVGAATMLMPKGELGVTSSGAIQVSLAANGDLAFIRYGDRATRVDLVDRSGSVQYLPFPRAAYLNPRVSPDGRRIMVEVSGLRAEAFDLERLSMTRLTPEVPGMGWPIWNLDGTAVFFRGYNLPHWIATDGTGQEGEIPGGKANDYPSGPGPDPDSLLAVRVTAATSGDVTLISRAGAFEPKAVFATPAYEGGGQLSPDGRWLVYATNETGQFEIQVRRFPAADRMWRVSAGFGGQPHWRADGREISYRDGRNMVVVPFDGSKEEPVIGKPAPLFKDDYDFGLGLTTANYHRTRDGRFVMLRRDTSGISVRLVLNWTEELKKIMESGAG